LTGARVNKLSVTSGPEDAASPWRLVAGVAPSGTGFPLPPTPLAALPPFAFSTPTHQIRPAENTSATHAIPPTHLNDNEDVAILPRCCQTWPDKERRTGTPHSLAKPEAGPTGSGKPHTSDDSFMLLKWESLSRIIKKVYYQRIIL